MNLTSKQQIVLGGVRGSSPVADPRFMHYGGATTSVLVESASGDQVVFDAGTGLQMLQPLLAASGLEQPVAMFFTHYHLDHLNGLPSFAPLYNPQWNILFASPAREGVTAEEAVSRLISPPFWPVRFRARQRFTTLAETCGDAPYRHGAFDVRWCAVHHTNGCHAYRVDERATGASMVFATDLEWELSTPDERDALLRLCREPEPVDVLIMEGHYDLDGHSGWGHSRWQDAIDVATRAEARRLVITHHAPECDDAVLAAREQRVREAMPNACLGRQNMRLDWQKSQ